MLPHIVYQPPADVYGNAAATPPNTVLPEHGVDVYCEIVIIMFLLQMCFTDHCDVYTVSSEVSGKVLYDVRFGECTCVKYVQRRSLDWSDGCATHLGR